MAGISEHSSLARTRAVANAPFSPASSPIADAASIVLDSLDGAYHCLRFLKHNARNLPATSPHNETFSELLDELVSNYSGLGVQGAHYVAATHLRDVEKQVSVTDDDARAAALVLCIFEGWSQMILVDDEVRTAKAHGRIPRLYIR